MKILQQIREGKPSKHRTEGKAMVIHITNSHRLKRLPVYGCEKTHCRLNGTDITQNF